MQPDLRNVRVLLALFVMPGCGACDEYLPRFERLVRSYQARGVPFHIWREGQAIELGSIPVLIYDAAAENDELQAFADRLGITATPTTAMMTRRTTVKIEGAIEDDHIARLLNAAMIANR